METNKWKVPDWCKVGTRVRIARGRAHPIGLVGTVTHVSTTGSGAKAYVKPTLDSPVQLGYTLIQPEVGIGVWCANLEPA